MDTIDDVGGLVFKPCKSLGGGIVGSSVNGSLPPVQGTFDGLFVKKARKDLAIGPQILYGVQEPCHYPGERDCRSLSFNISPDILQRKPGTALVGDANTDHIQPVPDQRGACMLVGYFRTAQYDNSMLHFYSLPSPRACVGRAG